MPNNRMNSIQRPRVYEGLRARGVSKTRAAKIANAGTRRRTRPFPSRGTPADRRLARNRRR